MFLDHAARWAMRSVENVGSRDAVGVACNDDEMAIFATQVNRVVDAQSASIGTIRRIN